MEANYNNSEETLMAIERLQATQKRLTEELEEQNRRAEEATNKSLDSRPTGVVGSFQKVGLEYVDQDKLERIRRGKEKARAIREAAQRDILAWREEFRSKFNGSNPEIYAASGELVMKDKW